MSSHIGDANKKSHATVGGIAIDAEFAEPGMGIAEFRPFAERQLIASTSAAPGIDRRVRELLARRLRQWRTHLPADPAKPGTRAIRTYDHPGLEGETDYNNDVAIWREACSVLDEALTLIDASPKGGESMHNWSLRMAKLEEGQHIGAGAHGLQDSPKGGSDARYFSADPAFGEFTTHDTLQAAIDSAESMLSDAGDEAHESGWTDDPPQICYGVVLGACSEVAGSRKPAPEGSEFAEHVEFKLQATSAEVKP